MKSDNHSQPWEPYHILGADRDARWLVVCDHAANVVPDWVNGGDLGVSPDDMTRHIAVDVGAAGMAAHLAAALGASAILSNFSRLVIDPNRGEDDPTLVMQLYDGTLISGNRGISPEDVNERLERCHRPYHKALAALAGRREDTVIVSVHSFTPQFRGRPLRPWHCGLLYAEDTRLSLPLVGLLEEVPGLVVGANKPYTGYLEGDTIDRHAIEPGRQNTLIEVRNDLIKTDAGQEEWAERFAELLPKALEMAEA